MLKRILTAGAAVAAFGAGLAQAQQPAAPAEPASPHTITGNVGLFSQYIFRGMTQTNGDPAIQGGLDYSHSSGFYAGTWASNVSLLKENLYFNPAVVGGPNIAVPGGTYSGGGSMEWDFYGGYKWGFAPDWTLDLGTLYYWYPGDISILAPVGTPKADTWEVYAGLNWKWLSAKYSYSMMNKTFGVLDASGTWYLDFSANIPLGDFWKEATGFTIMAHWGWQKYSGNDPRNVPLFAGGPPRDNDSQYSYKDWKLGLSYALPKDFTIGAFYSKAYDYSDFGYGSALSFQPGVGNGPYPKDLGRGTGTVYIQKTF